METARALKMFKKEPCALFEFSIQSFVYGATTVAKVSLFSTWTRSTVSLLYVSVENDTFSREQSRYFSTQTDFPYLGLVNVLMISSTCCS